MSLKDHYALLEVPYGCIDLAELRKAYKCQAKRHHPDKNPSCKATATKRFQEVREAYAALCQYAMVKRRGAFASRRAATNEHHTSPPKDTPSGAGWPPKESTENAPNCHKQPPSPPFARTSTTGPFKRTADDVYNGANGSKRRRPAAARHVVHCTLEEMCVGATKPLLITRTVELIDVENAKSESVTQTKIVSIHIDPGSVDGDVILLPGLGDKLQDSLPQDILVVLRQKPHALFTRDGSALHCRLPLTLAQWARGDALKFNGVDGKQLVIETGALTGIPARRRFVHCGMPEKSGQRGDLLVELILALPITLSTDQRRELLHLVDDCEY